MISAITRKVASSFNKCELTYLQRQKIDIDKAREQHRDFELYLEKLGVRVLSLDCDDDLPDSVFVEDNAVITKNMAVITSMGVESRKGEPRKLAEVLKQFRQLEYIDQTHSLEGGDVVEADDAFYVGVSTRTSREGFGSLAQILTAYQYKVVPVEVKGCLHLTTGSTYIGNNTMLANPDWVDVSKFRRMEIIEVDPAEPWAGNALRVNGSVLLPKSSVRTAEKLSSKGFEIHTVDISELEKAEAGLTCMCLLF